jgi:hypothetical protein
MLCAAAVLTASSYVVAQSPAVDSTKLTEKQSSDTKFLRLSKDGDTVESLDIAVTTYKAPGPEGATVDLVGAVHIGDGSYYDELNTLFDTYDVMLYELVAPEGTVIPKGGRVEPSNNPIAMLQSGAQNMLGLESQLEKVDYTKSHFVRADMTPEQISAKMKERGDTVFTLAMSAFTDAMRTQNLQRKGNDSEMMKMMERTNVFELFGNPQKMKLMMAYQFAETGSLDASLGESLNQLLIVDRNAVAVEGLKKQLADGKKKIGIFYGAAHMPDFEEHLTQKLGLEKVEQKWLKAWDLTTAVETPKQSPASLLMNLLKGN